MEYTIIAARSSAGVIAVDGKIPWWDDEVLRKEDLARFKRLTFGKAAVMGRKTGENPKRPVSNRVNIALTRHSTPLRVEEAEQFFLCYNLAEVERHLRHSGLDVAYVIGGGEGYSQLISMPETTRLELTTINGDFVRGDLTMFPPVFEVLWELKGFSRREGDKYTYIFETYQRRK